MQQLLESNELILMDASVVERLRRDSRVNLHDTLLNASLIYDRDGREALSRIYNEYLSIAEVAKVPFLMSTPTWRANYSRVSNAKVAQSINADAVRFMRELMDAHPIDNKDVRIGGLIGCQNDCYLPEQAPGAVEAEAFHSWQIEHLVEGGADYLIAETLPDVDEAVGIARAMERTSLPCIISFVINRNGKVLDGTPLMDAIKLVDASTRRNPLGYMINCSYPTFLCAEQQPVALFSRLIGFLANGSSLDHCDLEDADHLHMEKVSEWGDAMLELNRTYGITVLGGCCGTDAGHLRQLVG